jgi:hypothetical protein
MPDTVVAQNYETQSCDFEDEFEEDSSEKLEKMQKLLKCQQKIAELRHILRENNKHYKINQ